MKLEKTESLSITLAEKELDFLARRESTIIANRSLVYWLAKRFKVSNEVYQALVQEGLCALCRAADNFNYDTDPCFTTYAYYRVKSAMLRYLDSRRTELFVNVYEQFDQNMNWMDDVEEANLLLKRKETDVIQSFMMQKGTGGRMGLVERLELFSALVFSKLKLAILALLPSR